MRSRLALAVGLTLVLPFGIAVAIPITSINQLVVFGDSLSDAGNAYIGTGGVAPGPNYATRSVPGIPSPVGYLTDGPSTTPPVPPGGPTGLWIDQLSTKLGVPDPQPSLAPLGGANYAVALAQTGSNGSYFVSDQIAQFSATHLSGAPSTALYTIWAGADDILNGKNPVTAADNLYANILTLHSEGAQYFLWPNLPPIGDTPLGYTSNQVAALNALSAAFNAEWAVDLAKLHSLNIQVVGMDINGLFNQILANPKAFGFSDVTDPAQGVAGINPDTYLFWDDLHPTTEADALIANLAFTDLAAPEPASLILAVIGVSVLLVIARIRRSSVGC